MTTVTAGSDAALVFVFSGGDITDAQITIEPAAGGSPVVGPTSAGIGSAGFGRYTYVWSVPADTTPGMYVAAIAGTDGGPVEASVPVAVTGLPVYVSLADFKAYREVEQTTEDPTIPRDPMYLQRINAAARAIDRKCGRRFWLDTVASARTIRTRGRVRRTRDGDVLLTPDIGTLDGLEVVSGSTEVTGYSAYTDDLEPGRDAVTGLFRAGGWHAGEYTLTTRWGWPVFPDDIVEANTLLANRLTLRANSPEGIAASGEWGAIRVSRWDPDIESLLSPYVLPGIA